LVEDINGAAKMLRKILTRRATAGERRELSAAP